MPDFAILPKPLRVLCINLDEEVERMATIRELFGDLSGFDLVRHPALLGSRLPRAIFPALTKSVKSGPGTLACFLAHVAAWESVASGDAPVLIIEDDVRPIGLHRLFDVAIPADADLLFVNGRMADGFDGDPVVSATASILPKKAAEELKDASVGGDGYLLFPGGARKLLAAVERDGVGGHVDWRLFRYALTFADVAALPEKPWFADRAILRERGPGWGVITAYRLSRPLIHYYKSMGSMRLKLDQAAKAAQTD